MSAISPHDGPVAVTGCSGFTGGHMVRELVLYGYKVHACIRDASSWRGKDSIAYLSKLPNVTIFEGCDLFTEGSFHAAIAGCSAVFHIAAVQGNSMGSQPLGSGNLAEDIYNGGMVGTQNIVNAINASNSVKRVLYTSSVAAICGPATTASQPEGYEWTETDWASDGASSEQWDHPANCYAKSKVDTEHFLNKASEISGQWDVISMFPSLICGPLLFKAQLGQWTEQIGRLASGLAPNWPSDQDMIYNIIDVRDLVKAQRLAAESSIDHRDTLGGPRYLMFGSGKRSELHLGTEVVKVIADLFPRFVLGKPVTETADGKPIALASKFLSDCRKAKSILGVTIRPAEDTIRDVVESSIESGIILPRLR